MAHGSYELVQAHRDYDRIEVTIRHPNDTTRMLSFTQKPSDPFDILPSPSKHSTVTLVALDEQIVTRALEQEVYANQWHEAILPITSETPGAAEVARYLMHAFPEPFEINLHGAKQPIRILVEGATITITGGTPGSETPPRVVIETAQWATFGLADTIFAGGLERGDAEGDAVEVEIQVLPVMERE